MPFYKAREAFFLSKNNVISYLLHVDIWGPFFVPSIHGHCFFFKPLLMMKAKFETKSHLQHFITLIKTQIDTKVKHICSDNGLKFTMTSFYSSNKIIHQTPCVEIL